MITLHNPKIVGEWYTPKSQRDEPDPFRVRLRSLTGLQKLEILEANRYQTTVFRTPALRLAWLYGVAGHEGVAIPDGLSLEGRNLADFITDAEILQEVANEVLERSEPTDDEKKS